MQLSMQQVTDKYAALSLRERIIVGVAMIVAVVVIWLMLVRDPLNAGNSQAREAINKLQTQIAALAQQQNELLRQQRQDPNAELQQRVDKLRAALDSVEQTLRKRFSGLVDPQQMADVLEDLLIKNQRLELVRIESLPSEALISAGAVPETNSDASANEARVAVYRHGVQIQFRGSYLATLDYLRAIEQLPWDFYWEALRLQVEDYPKASVTITVHTLSLKRGWIGV